MSDLLLDARAFAIAHPLFAATATVAVYAVAAALWRGAGQPALLHPVLVASAAVGLALVATGQPHAAYFASTAALHHALGALVILLAVPLAREAHRIRATGARLLPALALGAAVGVATALAPAYAADAPETLLAALAPKSATTAVAVGISERLGGATAVTAVVVIATGLVGGAAGPSILRAAGVTDHRAVGFALGVASHAIGTARAVQISGTAAAFASIGMILDAALTIALAPLALAIL